MKQSFIAVLLTLSLTSLLANAQTTQPPNLQPIEDGAPVLSAGDAAYEPEVTIRREGVNQIREFRINGRLYKIEVRPDNGPAYVLMDMKGDAQWMKIESYDPLLVPQWVLIRF